MLPQQFVTLAPLIARTVSGVGEAFDLTKFLDEGRSSLLPMQLLVQAEVTVVSGTATPSITFTLEDSLDGGVTWRTIGTFTAITTVSQQRIQIAISGVAQAAGFAWPFNAKKVRVRWAVAGTNPSLTSSVKVVIL